MDQTNIKLVIEAALLAASRPLPFEKLVEIFTRKGDGPDRAEIRAGLEALAADYEERGIELKEVSSGFRIQVRSSMADWLQPLWEERAPRYTRALLETLALIAYRQPITRGEIEEVRGVAVSSNIVRTLMERGWVRVVGHREVPGKPAMLGTTREFLDYFGLRKLEDLPTLAEFDAEQPQSSPQGDFIESLDGDESAEAGEAAEPSEAAAPDASAEDGAESAAGTADSAAPESDETAEEDDAVVASARVEGEGADDAGSEVAANDAGDSVDARAVDGGADIVAAVDDGADDVSAEVAGTVDAGAYDVDAEEAGAADPGGDEAGSDDTGVGDADAMSDPQRATPEEASTFFRALADSLGDDRSMSADDGNAAPTADAHDADDDAREAQQDRETAGHDDADADPDEPEPPAEQSGSGRL